MKLKENSSTALWLLKFLIVKKESVAFLRLSEFLILKKRQHHCLKVFNTEKRLHHFLRTLKVFNIEKWLCHILITCKVYQNSYSVECWWTAASEGRSLIILYLWLTNFTCSEYPISYNRNIFPFWDQIFLEWGDRYLF